MMINKIYVLRLLKISLLVSATTLLLLSFIDNILAYHINFEYVKHVLSMDDTFKDPILMVRAIHNPIYYHLFYCFIICLEGLTSLVLLLGVYQSLKNIKQVMQQYNQAKFWGEVGLLLALFIYCFLFFAIGTEWFASWQSQKWNSKVAATPFILFLGIIYFIFIQPEREEY